MNQIGSSLIALRPLIKWSINKSTKKLDKMVTNSVPGFARIKESEVVSSLSDRAQKVFNALTNPIDNSSSKLYDQYSTDHTGNSTPYRSDSLNWKGTVAADMAESELTVAVFRDPMRGTAIQFVDFELSTKYVSAPQFIPANGNWGVLSYSPSQATDVDIHGPLLIPGWSSEQCFYWVNLGENVTITLASAATSDPTGQTTATLRNTTSKGRYFCLYMPDNYDYQTAATTATLSITRDSGHLSKGYGLRPIPGILAGNGTEGFQRGRCTGVSVLISNVSSAIGKHGKIAAYQCPGNTDFTDFPTFESVTRNKGHRVLVAETGVYQFLRIADAADTQFQDYLPHGNYGYDLDLESNYILICLSVVASEYPRDFNMTVGWNHEFFTGNMNIDLTESIPDPNVYNLVVGAMSRIPAIYENPSHVANLKKYATAILKGIKDYGPAVVSMVSKILPLIAAV